MKGFNVSKNNRVIVLIVSVFATNLFYYSVVEPGMSHVYSFAMISAFLYYGQQYFIKPSNRLFMFMSIVLGTIILIRPVNILIVLSLPFIAIKFSLFKAGVVDVFRNRIATFFSIFLFLIILFIQLLIYKISTGHYFVYSYQEEGFHFLAPHIFDVLFSYKKGLFVYTPVFLFSLFGLVSLYKKSKYLFFSILIFLFTITYVLSSWWMWYYGGSFSSRVYVEYIPLFMILLGISLNNIKSLRTRVFYLFLLGFLVVMCQIQTYQYRYFDIHWVDMNKEKYWDVFMRIDKFFK